jgi:hypothetical protein
VLLIGKPGVTTTEQTPQSAGPIFPQNNLDHQLKTKKPSSFEEGCF